MAEVDNTIPLSIMMDTKVNMYELTNAAIHRAEQIVVTGAEEIESGKEKVVSVAIKEIVTGEVQYKFKN